MDIGWSGEIDLPQLGEIGMMSYRFNPED